MLDHLLEPDVPEPTDLEGFVKWYAALNPNEPVDMNEAREVFFNLQRYDEEVI
ncbi:MAG TPA: hypothetical protein VIJ14_08135 [Rhabdochlamydiaceae bacterium]